MTKTKKTVAVIAAVMAGAGAVALALAIPDGKSTAEAKTDLCNSLSDLSSTVMKYEGLDPRTSTNDERDAAADDIESAWDDVVDDAHDVVWADDNALTQAYDDLYWAIQGLPGDYTIAESVDALEPELTAFPQAYRETVDYSGCPSTIDDA